MEIINIVKVFIPASAAFIVGIAITPLVTHFLYKYKAWKKKGGKQALDGTEAKVFNSLKADTETKTPRMGGVVIWLSSFITIIGLWLLARIFPNEITNKLDFLSRGQTWIPLFTLLAGAFVGLFNDILDVLDKPKTESLSLLKRLSIITALSLFVGWWFYSKLDVASIGVPFDGDLTLGLFFIPFFIIVVLAIYAGGVIDGIDGLSGGVFAAVFSSYAGVAFYQSQINLAAFCAMIAGAILSFLWFNIPPARFYMTETGTMGLTITLAVVAFMTDSLGGGHGVLALPIIAFPLVITVLSNILQISSKKMRGKKIFRVAPLHHHFEAIGWPSYKVTMRFWVVSVIFAIIGLTFALLG